ncbi:hypothetical protein BU17DRAFT_95617 [Hysterangium stoloniferum]|nr:hypothetical protein BU17DRAFT_95617 [Hysterangium stoloniferum]
MSNRGKTLISKILSIYPQLQSWPQVRSPQGTPSDSGHKPLTTPDAPTNPLNLKDPSASPVLILNCAFNSLPGLDSDTLYVRHGTKPSSPRLSTTSRPRFFLPDDSDSDESPAQRSFRRREIILTRPVTKTPRLVRNRAQLPWASLTERISRYQDSLMVYKLLDFDHDVEVADWNEKICTKLETMRALCKASHSNLNFTYDGEPKP